MARMNTTALIAASAMASAGAFLTVSLAAPQSVGGWGSGWLCLPGPTSLAMGLLGVVRGFVGARIFSRRNLLIAGVILIAPGAYPWAYAGLLSGGRPGNELEGMIGTLLFISVGVPAVIVTMVGFSDVTERNFREQQASAPSAGTTLSFSARANS